MKIKEQILAFVFSLCLCAAPLFSTEVSIVGDQFYIDGQPTYKDRTWNGKRIQGLLLNSRMVQGIFDDSNPSTRSNWKYPDTGQWDAIRNNNEFVQNIPLWRSYGLLAFTINIQGGCPYGYCNEQPWQSSGFNTDGTMWNDYKARLKKIIDKADQNGMVVILGIYYFGQDQRMENESAVTNGVLEVVNFVFENNYKNVVIEIANECDLNYDHDILKPSRIVELINLVKSLTDNGRRLLVSTSFTGGTVPPAHIIKASDFVLLHGNGLVFPSQVTNMINKVRQSPGYDPKPIVFNEDDHLKFFETAVSGYASWGWFAIGKNNYKDGYQNPPINWGINTDEKRAFFGKVGNITGERVSQPPPNKGCGQGSPAVVVLAIFLNWGIFLFRKIH